MGASSSASTNKEKSKVTQTEVTDSVAMMIEKANNGDAVAQNTVGSWYYYGKEPISQDYTTALQYWALSAKQDNVDAIANMAMCYQLGRGTEKDSTMAMGLYKAALKKGNEDIIPQHKEIVEKTGSLFSCVLLKDCYQKGIGVKKDASKYVYYLEKIAESNDVEAQFELALHYLNNKQADKAAPWFKKAAEQGQIAAIYYYGYLKYYGQGIVQDKTGGITLFQEASKKSFPMADYQLGRIYYSGDGADQDFSKAVEYLKKAATQNIDKAKWLLGLCYIDGKGVDQNYYFATQWLAEAFPTHRKEFAELMSANENTPYGEYMKGLRLYYVDKDYDAAISCFKNVAKNKIAEGKTMLGVCYGNKDYAKRNTKKAVKLLRKAAPNSPAAKYYLSSMYETGTGVKQDAGMALALLKEAADKGVGYAQCKLGDLYMVGEGVTQDLTKAAQLYLQAEVQGHLTTKSARNLAECYKRKIACLPDLVDSDKRIENLNNHQMSGILNKMLKEIK